MVHAFMFAKSLVLYCSLTAVKPKKPTLTPEQKKNPNLLLVPNPKVKVWTKDPFTDME